MKKVLIFGAASRLAQAVASELVKSYSCEVRLIGHKGSCPDERNSEIKIAGNCDIADWKSVNDTFNNCVRDGFVPSVVINCAGVSGQCPISEMNYEEWRRVTSVNLDGSFNVCQNAISFMKESQEHSSIILIGSAYGKRFVPNLAHYCTSKAAVSALVKALSVEVARYNISINAVVPTMFLSNMTAPFYYNESYVSQLKEHFPAGELIDFDAIVRAVIYLAQENSPSVNGTEIVVDGGFLNRIEGGIV